MVFPSGVIAINPGPRPTGIGGPAMFVAVSIGVTVPPRPFDTYTVRASPDTSSPQRGASSAPDCVALQGRPVKGSFAVANAMAQAPPWTVPPFQAVSGSYRMRHLYASAR